MGLLDDIMKTLDRWDVWREVRQTPAKIDALATRVAALEEKLGGKSPPDVCKFCGERTTRLTAARGPTAKGNMTEHWTCSSCGQVEIRQV